MIKILVFLAVVFGLGLGFAWLADRPGDMVVTFDGYQYTVSLMAAAVAVTAFVALVMITWWLVKAIWTSPYTIARYFRVRQRDRGYQALSTGMIAAGAGDGAMARKMNKQAAKLIRSDQEPLLHLLDAQASLIEGDHDAAREKFDRMLDDPEMRLLGLRGLFLEAERLGNRDAARHYAGRAAELAPQLGWAAESTLEGRVSRGDWDGAITLVDAQKSTRQVDREATNNRRAVLLTAKALDLVDTDLASAKTAAVEANRLRPDFVPAAVVAAKALFRQNDVRRGSKLLEATWKAEPHPEIADLYVHALPGDAVLDRLARARRLQSIKQNHPESSLAVARAALEAGDYGLARSEVDAAIRMQPREGAYLLLADIEEADTGDQGRVRQCLSRAVRAPRDPAWVADGYVAERWAPASPVTGRIDAFEWRVPVERLGPMIEPESEELERPKPALAAPKTDTVKPVEVIAQDEASNPVSVVEKAAPVAAAVVPGAAPEQSRPEPTTLDTRPAEEAEAPAEVIPPRLPDDPGVEPMTPDELVSRRFRLF